MENEPSKLDAGWIFPPESLLAELCLKVVTNKPFPSSFESSRRAKVFALFFSEFSPAIRDAELGRDLGSWRVKLKSASKAVRPESLAAISRPLF